MSGWIGVDLDGTLAYYDGIWRGRLFVRQSGPETVSCWTSRVP